MGSSFRRQFYQGYVFQHYGYDRQPQRDYEKELQEAREKALAEMSERAAKLGADAVVGVDVDYEVLGETNAVC